MGAELTSVAIDQRARALLDRNRPLSVRACGQAGDSQRRRFLLQTAGVRHDHGRLRSQGEKVQIAERGQIEEAARPKLVGQAEVLDPPPGSGMNGKDQRQRPRRLHEDVQERGKRSRRVHVCRTVQRHHSILAGLESVSAESVSGPGLGQEPKKGVDHHVPHKMHRALLMAFAPQVVDAGRLGHQEQVRDRIGDKAVDLLGHGTIEAPQPRFDVRDGDPQFYGSQGGRQRGVDVAHHEHAIERGAAGWPLLQDGLQTLEHLGRLGPVFARSHVEVHVGLRHPQFLEEDVRTDSGRNAAPYGSTWP